jgi:AraC-like DNA-binding protein
MIGSQSGLRQISCLLELLEGLANAAPKPVARPPVGAKPAWAAAERARRLDAYLLQALHGPVAQSEVARAVGLSSGGFSRFFAAHFGKPFVKYLAELRVRRARELLAMEDLPVSEVASASGYSNLSSFNRQFARLEGMTPSEYRRLAPVHRFTSMSGRVANTAIA